jgi:hypothetical protein
MRVTDDIPLGCSLLLPVDTVNCVQTLKATATATISSKGCDATFPKDVVNQLPHIQAALKWAAKTLKDNER